MTTLPQVRHAALIERIMDCLRAAGDSWITAMQIAQTVYADCPKGGPMDAEGSVQVTIWRERNRHDLPIESKRGVGYRLAAIPCHEERASLTKRYERARGVLVEG